MQRRFGRHLEVLDTDDMPALPVDAQHYSSTNLSNIGLASADVRR
jgi:hypothetical protein